MQSDSPSIQIESTSEFQRKLRTLAKKYRRIANDIQPIIAQLQSGEQIGNQISGLEGYVVFKARVKNSEIQKGIKIQQLSTYLLRNPLKIRLRTSNYR